MSATFTPPTHTEYFAPAGRDRLWSRVPYQQAETVLLEDGVATLLAVVDSDRLIADAVYSNGVTYEIDPADEPALSAAVTGAGLALQDETWPAWLL